MQKKLRAVKAYETFHGKTPMEIRRGEFHIPSHLILLGDAKEIVYECDKFNGGGDGKKTEYVHKFSRGVKIYMDERRSKVLYISGQKLKVNHRGIIN